MVAMETSVGGFKEDSTGATNELAIGMRGGLVEVCIGGCCRDK